MTLTEAQRVTAAAMSETALLDMVIERAEWLGWRVIHVRPARTEKGWRTAIQGTWSKGWPDLACVHPVKERFLVAELKRQDGELTPEQADWLSWLRLAGVECHIWRPSDWLSGRIDEVLQR